MIRKLTVAHLVLLAAFAGETIAQGLPTTSQLETEKKRIDRERAEMFRPDNRATRPQTAMPSANDIAGEMPKVEQERKALFDPNNPATVNAPNVFPDVPTPEPSGIDIETIARQYEQKAAARKMNDLMVFASFSMPKESLKRIVSQANRIGASVVFRGFKNNSWKETALAIGQLGEQNGNILINPLAFTKYQVAAVPTMVIVKADAVDQVDNEGCALPDNYVAVAGDVSLDYALDEVAQRSPSFEPLATRYLRQFRGN